MTVEANSTVLEPDGPQPMHFADLLLKHELIGSGRKSHWCLNPPHSDCGVETAMAFLRSKRSAYLQFTGYSESRLWPLHQDWLLNHASNDRGCLKEPVGVKMWIVDLKNKSVLFLTFFVLFLPLSALLLQGSVFLNDYISFNTFSFQHKSSYRSIFPWCSLLCFVSKQWLHWTNEGLIWKSSAVPIKVSARH